MRFSKSILALTAIMVLAITFGCSNSESPISPDNLPLNDLTETGDSFNGIGILGAFELTIDPDEMTAELVPIRHSTIGESYIVSGIGFFTVAPCSDCLVIKGLSFIPGNDLTLTFTVTHPFDKGNISEEPSAVNRNDLDVFDLAMVIAPQDATETTFNFAFEKVYDTACANPDGYTLDIFEVTLDDVALPYFLVIDENEMDPIPDPTTWNRFEMGSSADFDVSFQLTPGASLTFDTYLTMGYGASAKKPDRLDPKYYNPEFNRKSAWKVVVTPPQGEDPPAQGNTWDSTDTDTFYTVTVEVYDWQQDAPVYTGDNYEEADPSEIYAISNVVDVKVEILGMTLDWVSAVATAGTGMPGDPLIFELPVRNQNGLAAGEYPGLVTVIDERLVGDPYIDNRDILIDSPDGVTLNYWGIPAFQTQQVFTATVVEGL